VSRFRLYLTGGGGGGEPAGGGGIWAEAGVGLEGLMFEN
jgi:hypothetical protein